VLHTAKHSGITGGTVFNGKGTVNIRILEYLGLTDIRKEIVWMVADQKTARKTLEILDKEFRFEKPNHGIAFTTSVSSVIGASRAHNEIIEEESGENRKMYQVITVIVEKGQAENVIDAAIKAGSKGGTIINARGSGLHETSKLFAMDIEPEKEIVMILAENAQAESIVSSIREATQIDEPGRGIIFVQDVSRVYGLYE
jgi:nitrogen regulatory protein PII